MRLTTWNVNGIRNPFGYAPWNVSRTFPAMFEILQADIVVMQELKIQRKDLRDDMVLLDGWDCYFSLPKQKKGYSGVGIYTRNATCAPIKAEEGVLGVLCPAGSTTTFRDLPEEESIGGYPSPSQLADIGVDPVMLDSEGRCVCLEFPAFVLFGVYSPANSNGLRDDFRYGFLCALDCRIRNLIKAGKNVVLVGDLNVSREEIDTANGEEDRKKEGLSHAQYISTPNRRIFNQMIIGGDVIGERDEGREDSIMWDIVREYHPDRKGMFTHWEQKVNARPGNFGSRIDFVLASRHMKEWFMDANIQEGLMGSDHCPVFGTFKDIVPFRDPSGVTRDRHMADIMNPPGYMKDGSRVKEWSIKDVPSFSGKLLPEFDKRRSIKDMFKKPAIAKASTTTQPSGLAVVCSASDNSDITSSAPDEVKDEKTIYTQSPSANSSTQTSHITKRKASDTPAAAAAALKRQKPNSQTGPKKQDTNKGQSCLKGFFAPKPTQSASSTNGPTPAVAFVASTTQDNESTNGNGHIPNGISTSAQENQTTTPPASQAASQDLATPVSTKPDPPPPPSISSLSTPSSPSSSAGGRPNGAVVHDPIVAKDSWSKLMARPAVPNCEHGEPCKTMLTRKKGENQGRSFYMCARPLGPSGAKEKNSQWRCSTFVWCSETKR